MEKSGERAHSTAAWRKEGGKSGMRGSGGGGGWWLEIARRESSKRIRIARSATEPYCSAYSPPKKFPAQLCRRQSNCRNGLDTNHKDSLNASPCRCLFHLALLFFLFFRVKDVVATPAIHFFFSAFCPFSGTLLSLRSYIRRGKNLLPRILPAATLQDQIGNSKEQKRSHPSIKAGC